MDNTKKLDQKSLVVHHPAVAVLESNAPLVGPLYHSIKYELDSIDTFEKIRAGEPGFYYSRVSNPTVLQLETLLADLQGRDAAIATASGVGAISSCLLSLLKSKDHVVLFLESYKPLRTIVTKILAKFGVEYSLLSLKDFASQNPIIPGKTKLVIFESPTNPMLFIADILSICEAASKAKALTVLDNTFAGLHQHRDFPIDLYIHSLTKYASGHGDVMGGAIIGSKDLIAEIRQNTIDLGPTLDPQAAFLILRGLKTYFLRYERQCENAYQLACWLEAHPKIKNVIYPGLESHPQHHLAKQQMSDFGAMIACDLASDDEQSIRTFIKSLNLFQMAASLGSTESLVAPVDLFYAQDLSNEQKHSAGISKTSLRFSLGIEANLDLIEDLEQALCRI